MKVVDFIKRLNEIGFNEDTELTFSCINGETGNWYTLEADKESGEDGFYFGTNLTGSSYCNDQIDFCLNVDECTEYLDEKKSSFCDEFTDDLNEIIYKCKQKFYR